MVAAVAAVACVARTQERRVGMCKARHVTALPQHGVVGDGLAAVAAVALPCGETVAVISESVRSATPRGRDRQT